MPYNLDRLEHLETTLKNLRAKPDASAANEFMSGFLDFYLASLGEASLRQSVILKRMSENLLEALPWIELYYVGGLESFLQSTWHGPEWVSACRRRTAIEGFNELFGKALKNDHAPD